MNMKKVVFIFTLLINFSIAKAQTSIDTKLKTIIPPAPNAA